jgi:hypothetical protein
LLRTSSACSRARKLLAKRKLRCACLSSCGLGC